MSNPQTLIQVLSLHDKKNKPNPDMGNSSSQNSHFTRKLYMKVDKSHTEEVLKEYLKCFGQIDSLKLKRHKPSSKSRNFGYVSFKSPLAATAAPTFGELNHSLVLTLTRLDVLRLHAIFGGVRFVAQPGGKTIWKLPAADVRPGVLPLLPSARHPSRRRPGNLRLRLLRQRAAHRRALGGRAHVSSRPPGTIRGTWLALRGSS